MKSIGARIDENYSNSDTPTKTQSEEAFANMFAEMAGDFRWIIIAIGLAVGVSLLCVAANAMAMALRERTTEVAVLKAIGFGKPLVISLILAESLLIGAIGGLLGAIGCKLFCDCRGHLEVHRRDDAVLLRPLVHRDRRVARGSLGVGGLQRPVPRPPRRADLGRQRPQEGGLRPAWSRSSTTSGTSGPAG